MDIGTILILAGLGALVVLAVVVLVRRDRSARRLGEHRSTEDPGPSHADALGKAYASGVARRGGGPTGV